MKKNKAKKEITLDDLAVMVQNGFSELRTEFRSDLTHEIGELRSELKADLKLVNKKIDILDEKIEDIKADLNKKADRFELKGLEYRVEKLEKKYV